MHIFHLRRSKNHFPTKHKSCNQIAPPSLWLAFLVLNLQENKLSTSRMLKGAPVVRMVICCSDWVQKVPTRTTTTMQIRYIVRTHVILLWMFEPLHLPGKPIPWRTSSLMQSCLRDASTVTRTGKLADLLDEWHRVVALINFGPRVWDPCRDHRKWIIETYWNLVRFW